MPLGQRHITVDYTPTFGEVKVDDALSLKAENEALRSAQKNLALNKGPIYIGHLEEKLNKQEIKAREVSYTYALKSLYRNLFFLNNTIKFNESDSEDMKSDKQMERKLIREAMDVIKEAAPLLAKEEHPNELLTIENERIVIRPQDDALDFKLSGATRKAVNNVVYRMNKLKEFMSIHAPTFQPKLTGIVKEYTDYVQTKFDGKKAYLRERNDAEIVEETQKAIEMLIRDDSASAKKIDRARAEKDLAKHLYNKGLTLVCVPIAESVDRATEDIKQTKVLALRAAWDGYIERPKDTSACSETMKNTYYGTSTKVDPRKYNLNESPIWRICEQLPAFKEITYTLTESLGKIGFPPEKIKDLNYNDIAFAVNMFNYRSSQAVERDQQRDKSAIDGIKISCGRAIFFKRFVAKHEKEMRTMLTAQGKDKSYIDEVVAQMRRGKSVDGFDGHHNFPISDPDTYEKNTGKSWITMDNDENIVLMDKESHKLLHNTANNVNKRGNIINEDAKSSNLTVFTDQKSGQKFYYMIRVKEGIKGVFGVKREAIFDNNYLGQLVLDNTQVVNNQIQHVKDLKAKLDSQKTAQETAKSENEQAPLMNRPNHLGQKQYGGQPQRKNNLKDHRK